VVGTCPSLGKCTRNLDPGIPDLGLQPDVLLSKLKVAEATVNVANMHSFRVESKSGCISQCRLFLE